MSGLGLCSNRLSSNKSLMFPKSTDALWVCVCVWYVGYSTCPADKPDNLTWKHTWCPFTTLKRARSNSIPQTKFNLTSVDQTIWRLFNFNSDFNFPKEILIHLAVRATLHYFTTKRSRGKKLPCSSGTLTNEIKSCLCLRLILRSLSSPIKITSVTFHLIYTQRVTQGRG